jgi:uncharacterized protein with von Willebrand factor type A (vWA) domain
LDQLRQQLMQSYFNQMAGAMSDTSPEQLQRMKEMFNGLNELLEMRQRGQDTTEAFGRFMEQFGDFFPGSPATLDELLEQLARQLAAMQNRSPRPAGTGGATASAARTRSAWRRRRRS